MKIEDLENTKIYLSNEADRIKFQEKVFSLGVKWINSDTNCLQHLNSPFFFINDCYEITSMPKSCDDFFIKYEYKQIFLEDVLAIKKPKCKFKPFDKVLVRDIDNGRWRPRFFSWHNVDYSEDCPYPFEVTDGTSYKYCIPYDEKLANTTKNI